jgi:hypothetical protein
MRSIKSTGYKVSKDLSRLVVTHLRPTCPTTTAAPVPTRAGKLSRSATIRDWLELFACDALKSNLKLSLRGSSVYLSEALDGKKIF